MRQKIIRTGDLIPKGIRSTVKGDFSTNEKFEQLCELKRELEIKLRS